jgi:hypothetical protein
MRMITMVQDKIQRRICCINAGWPRSHGPGAMNPTNEERPAISEAHEGARAACSQRTKQFYIWQRRQLHSTSVLLSYKNWHCTITASSHQLLPREPQHVPCVPPTQCAFAQRGSFTKILCHIAQRKNVNKAPKTTVKIRLSCRSWLCG